MSDTVNRSPEGFYYDYPTNADWDKLNADVDKEPEVAIVTVQPVTMALAAIAPGETLGDFCRRMYGANTAAGRARILNANDLPLKGTVNVPLS